MGQGERRAAFVQRVLDTDVTVVAAGGSEQHNDLPPGVGSGARLS